MTESEEILRNIHRNLEDRMKIDREAAEQSQSDVSELIDGECSQCGREYYSEYLVQDRCIPCRLNR